MAGMPPYADLQRERVKMLELAGRDTADARHTLELFQGSLAIFEQHLQELTADTRMPNRK
jgi:hypothetical protein